MSIPVDDSLLPRNKTREICAAFRTLGAISPETALSEEALANIDVNALQHLVQRGVIRSTADRAYYLAEETLKRDTTRRYLATIAFWLLVLAIPIILLQFTS